MSSRRFSMGDISMSSTCSSEEVPYLFQLIEQEQWKELNLCLNSPSGKALCQETDRSNLTCLSLAVAFSAPIRVIQAILQTDPNLINIKDKYGATPLHVACLNGAKLDLITLLLRLKKSFALELDQDNRSPLHHAVEYAAQYHHDADYMLEVIQNLCQAEPEAIRKCDRSGYTPLDIVQHSKLVVRDTSSKEYVRLHLIYEKLRSTSISLYKEHKNRWELEAKLKQLNMIDKKQIETLPDITLSSGSSQAYSSINEERSMKASAAFSQQSESSQKKARRKY